MLYIFQLIALLIGYIGFIYYETRKYIISQTNIKTGGEAPLQPPPIID